VKDDDTFFNASHARIGEIKLEFHRVVRIKKAEFIKLSFSEPGKVHEQSKKATGHQVGLVWANISHRLQLIFLLV
jgi:hypothetical protein